SERLPGALQPVPHGRDTAADRRGRARARSSRAADAARHTRGLDRRIHVRCGRAARVRRGGYTVIVDVLIPTYGRPTALAVTLTSLCAQTMRPFRVVVSDQTDRARSIESAEVKAIARVLESHGCKVELLENLPRRGIAQQRQFLLDLATAPYALCLDDDVILEPYVIELLVRVIRRERCGFVGASVIGLSYVDDVRP